MGEKFYEDSFLIKTKQKTMVIYLKNKTVCVVYYFNDIPVYDQLFLFISAFAKTILLSNLFNFTFNYCK